MSTTNLLFVYGTLLQGECNHSWLGNSHLVAERVWVNGFLFNVGCGYPALVVAETDDCVFGEVYEVSADVLALIDHLEGYNGEDHPANQYERITVQVQGAAAPIEALTYVYTADKAKRLERLITGDWRIEGV
jgi:gamma-glutamylcyclotransferase (GGCT)/AIG2-like uncharacterized protein YtfP